MLSKIQKYLLWVFGAMFVLPEVIFSHILLSIINFSEKNLRPLYSLFIKEQFFVDNPKYLIISLVIEFIGVLGLFVINIKNKKKLGIIILGIIILWLMLLICAGYIVSYKISFP